MALSSDPIIHKPCAWNERGATRDLCLSMTKLPPRNHGCTRIQCSCSLRVCRVCVIQSGTPGLVVNPSSGLCRFHTENGENARPSRTMVPEKPDRIPKMLGKRPPSPAPSRPKPVPRPSAAALPVQQPDIPIVPKQLPPAAAQSVRRSSVLGGRQNSRYKGITARGEDGQMRSMMPLEFFNRVISLRDEHAVPITKIPGIVGISLAGVTNYLRFEWLVPEVLALLAAEPGRSSQLPPTHAVQLALLKPELQLPAAKRVIAGTLSFVQLKRYVKDPENRVARKRKEKIFSSAPRTAPAAPAPVLPVQYLAPERLLSVLESAVDTLLSAADMAADLCADLHELPLPAELAADVEAQAERIRKRLKKLLEELDR